MIDTFVKSLFGMYDIYCSFVMKEGGREPARKREGERGIPVKKNRNDKMSIFLFES